MAIQSIDRAVAILRLLSRHEEGLQISSVCAKLGLPLGTVHRFLHSLMDNGLVMQDPKTKFYRLGLELLRLSSSMLGADRLAEAARAPMQAAAARLKNIVYLSRAGGSGAICVSCVSSGTGEARAQFAAQVGGDMPFHAAAAGKIILAHAGPDRVAAAILRNSPLARYTANTKTSREEVMSDLGKCRERGYAVCDEELQIGVVAVAAPVFSFDGTVSASVAVTGIKAEVVMADLVDCIRKCAAEISRLQGYAG